MPGPKQFDDPIILQYLKKVLPSLVKNPENRPRTGKQKVPQPIHPVFGIATYEFELTDNKEAGTEKLWISNTQRVHYHVVKSIDEKQPQPSFASSHNYLDRVQAVINAAKTLNDKKIKNSSDEEAKVEGVTTTELNKHTPKSAKNKLEPPKLDEHAQNTLLLKANETIDSFCIEETLFGHEVSTKTSGVTSSKSEARNSKQITYDIYRDVTGREELERNNARKQYIKLFPEKARACVIARLEYEEATRANPAKPPQELKKLRKKFEAEQQKYALYVESQFLEYIREGAFNSELKTFLIPENAEEDPETKKEYSELNKELQRAESEYMQSEEGRRPILVHRFNLTVENKSEQTSVPFKEDLFWDNEYFEVQIPVGFFTPEQRQKLGLPEADELAANSKGCYNRDSEGISGLLLHATGYIAREGEPIVTHYFFRHATPVPIEEKDELKKMNMTIRNKDEFVENIAMVHLKAEAYMAIVTPEISTSQNTLTATPASKIPTQTALDDQLKITANKYIQEKPLEIDARELRLITAMNQYVKPDHFAQAKMIGQVFGTDSDNHIREINLSGNKTFVTVDTQASILGVNSGRHKFMTDKWRAIINTTAFNDLLFTKFNGFSQNLFKDSYRPSGASAKKIWSDLAAKLKTLSHIDLPQKQKIKFDENNQKINYLNSCLQKKLSAYEEAKQKYEVTQKKIEQLKKDKKVAGNVKKNKNKPLVASNINYEVQIQRQSALLKNYQLSCEIYKEECEELIDQLDGELEVRHELQKEINNKQRKLWHATKKQFFTKESGSLAHQLQMLIESAQTPDSENHADLAALQHLYLVTTTYTQILELMWGSQLGISTGNTLIPWRTGSRYYSKENNYWLQALMVLLGSEIGVDFATGCEQDKDRGSRLAITIEVFKVFKLFFGRYPHHQDKEDQARVKQLLNVFYTYSVNAWHVGYTSGLGAFGLKIYGRDGNEMLMFLGYSEKGSDRSVAIYKNKKIEEGFKETIKKSQEYHNNPMKFNISEIDGVIDELSPARPSINSSYDKITTVESSTLVTTATPKDESKAIIQKFISLQLIILFNQDPNLVNQLILKLDELFPPAADQPKKAIDEIKISQDKNYRKKEPLLYEKTLSLLSDVITQKYMKDRSFDLKARGLNFVDSVIINRIKAMAMISQDISKVKSNDLKVAELLNGAWHKSSRRLGFLNINTSRSEYTQTIDKWVKEYELLCKQKNKNLKPEEANAQLKNILREVLTATTAWIQHHNSAYSSTSRRTEVVSKLHEEATTEIAKLLLPSDSDNVSIEVKS